VWGRVLGRVLGLGGWGTLTGLTLCIYYPLPSHARLASLPYVSGYTIRKKGVSVKRVFEYWAEVHKPGYEVIGARPDMFRALPNAPEGEELNPIEPMLSLRDGWATGIRYESDYVAVNDYPALFLWFAQMKKTPEAVERFACHFGFLAQNALEIVAYPSFHSGHIQSVENSRIKPFGKNLGLLDGHYGCYAERLKSWYAGIDEMNKAIQLWEASKAGRAGATEKLQAQINEKLRAVSATAYLNSSGNSLELYVTPNHLYAALWLQLALAVDGRKAYKQCPKCQNWFEIGKWGSRADKKFCSNKCRQAAYDARKSARMCA
jgi:hypothetical protein